MNSNRCRLMVVDDEPIVCKRLKQILEKAGYEVAVFNDGENAIQELDRLPYDIIVTDLKMEGVDGMKILETAREKNPGVKVIMITGFAEMETAKEAFKKGVFDFVSKPVEVQTIKQVVSRAEEEISGLKKQ
jgi:DNA-binding NtrC family response regulator